MINELKIESISEYIQVVCSLQEEVGKYTPFENAELLFRGQSDVKYELIPAIGRNRDFDCECTIFNEERNLIEMAKYKLPELFRNDMFPVEILALLQHHGIPTRLLDVTENALVALYFACCNDEGKDGEVIVFKNTDDNVTNYPIINAIADSYRFTEGSTWTPLSSFYENVKSQPYFLEHKRIAEIRHKEGKDGGKWIEECCKKIFYIYAPIRSLRQQVQQGRYILFPNKIEHEIYDEGNFGWTIEAISKEHGDIVKRIIIPKESKKKLLSDVSVLGIREDVLFCDSVDMVCKGILGSFARKYR